MNKVTIKKANKKSGQSYNITFNGLTKGEILSITNALSAQLISVNVLVEMINAKREAQHVIYLGECYYLKHPRGTITKNLDAAYGYYYRKEALIAMAESESCYKFVARRSYMRKYLIPQLSKLTLEQ